LTKLLKLDRLSEFVRYVHNANSKMNLNYAK
jgi:hypothetical protein